MICLVISYKTLKKEPDAEGGIFIRQIFLKQEVLQPPVFFGKQHSKTYF